LARGAEFLKSLLTSLGLWADGNICLAGTNRGHYIFSAGALLQAVKTEHHHR
jgi:hypothetical protein